jgi:hypothetical protein
MVDVGGFNSVEKLSVCRALNRATSWRIWDIANVVYSLFGLKSIGNSCGYQSSGWEVMLLLYHVLSSRCRLQRGVSSADRLFPHATASGMNFAASLCEKRRCEGDDIEKLEEQ